ncbi:MAG: IspD/TarI family cytidylyltransferase, partial [Anaerotignaceae bacterium]
EETLNKGACSLAVPVKDTIKICSPRGEIEKGLDRKTLWAMQTPQGFNLSVLKKAYVDFIENNHVTDDAALMEIAGHKVFVVEGSYENIKITTAEDLIFAQCLLDLEGSRRLK